jgi:hypothetical protein
MCTLSGTHGYVLSRTSYFPLSLSLARSLARIRSLSFSRSLSRPPPSLLPSLPLRIFAEFGGIICHGRFQSIFFDFFFKFFKCCSAHVWTDSAYGTAGRSSCAADNAFPPPGKSLLYGCWTYLLCCGLEFLA